MAEHHCAGVPFCSALDMAEYKGNAANASEFNPRASPPSSSAAHRPRWPLNGHGAPFPPEPMPDSTPHAGPKWWVSPSPSRASPTAVYGSCAAGLPHHSVDSVDQSRLSVHDKGAPACVKDALQFVADLNRNNPYLDAALRSPSASWRQVQQQRNAAAPDDWSCNGSFSPYPQSCARPGFDQERGLLHPLYPDQHPSSAYTARAPYNFQQLAAADQLLVPPSYAPVMNGDGSFKAGDDHYPWGAATEQVRNVGKSQSMRALYEENAALRRALISMRRGSHLAMQGVHVIPGEQDRCIASDVAEGRAVSMRERGRWAMQAAGEVVGVGGNCSMWAGTPRHHWAAGPPLQAAGGGTHRHHHVHHQTVSWEDTAAEHPLFYAGGWPEDSMYVNRDHPHWADMENECQSGIAHEAAGREGTSLKQLLVETHHAGMNGHKWRHQGKKKESRSCEEMISKQAADEEGQCAMCGGKLGHVHAGGGKKAGLPLRLCPACHPRAAASLPHSTTTKSPPLTSQTRHQVATAIFMACRPHGTNTTVQDTKYATKKIKPKNRIVGLCRHFMGLAAKPPPPTA